MSGIEYISGDLSTHPQCPHGPTLLFSRCVNVTGDRRRFFACSACRDRKQCAFFLWESERESISDVKKLAWKIEQGKLVQDINHRKLFHELNSVSDNIIIIVYFTIIFIISLFNAGTTITRK